MPTRKRAGLTAVALITVAGVACKPKQAARETTPHSSQPTASTSTPVASTSALPATLPELRHAAVTTEERRCKDGNCFCAAPMGCGGEKPCITYDENVSAFRTALKGVGTGKDRRTVSCNQAEIGTCGKYRYFFFDGDIYRTELRFFDARGTFIGEIARTDYDEYCGGKASQRVRGAVPRCDPVRTELICGKAGDVSKLIESVLH